MSQDVSDMIWWLGRDDLENLLRDMRLYKACRFVSTSRASKLFQAKKTGKQPRIIEHFGNLDTQKDALMAAYTTIYWNAEGVEFVQNNELSGGVRMFDGDRMVEISVRDFEQLLLYS